MIIPDRVSQYMRKYKLEIYGNKKLKTVFKESEVISGIYFITYSDGFMGDEVIYVGKSVNVFHRLYRHNHIRFLNQIPDDIVDLTINLFVYETNDLSVENQFIYLYQPKCNSISRHTLSLVGDYRIYVGWEPQLNWVKRVTRFFKSDDYLLNSIGE